jgi:hypothetical protein
MVRAEQVIRGNVRPGSEYRLAWEYRPVGLGLIPQAPNEHGLWMLERDAGGTLRPLRLDASNPFLGGYFLALPKLPAYAAQAFSSDSSPEGILAGTLAAALEVVAAAEGDRLKADLLIQRSGAVSLRLEEAARQFRAVALWFDALDSSAALPVCRRLAASPYPNLRAVGLAGLLRSGDEAALLKLERDAASLAETVHVIELARSIDSFLISNNNNPAVALALARIAVGEAEIPTLDGKVFILLGRMARPEALPYLAVLMENPAQGMREMAIRGFCSFVRRAQPSRRLEWEPYCPQRIPISDAALAERCSAFWRSWWEGQRREFEQDPAFPRPVPPARYATATLRPDYSRDASLEQTFGSVVRMFAAYRQMLAARASATPDRSPSGGRTPMSSRLSTGDDEKLNQTTLDVMAKLDAQEQKMRDLQRAFFAKSTQSNQDLLKAASKEPDEILKRGLEELRWALSSQGWAEVEKFMRDNPGRITGSGPPAGSRPAQVKP